MAEIAKKDVNVVVFGKKNGSALDIVRCLGQVSYTVYLVLVCNNVNEFNLVAKSKFVNKAIQIDRNNRGRELQVLKDLSDQIGGEAVFFPIDDYAMSFLDTYFDDLNKMFSLVIKSGQTKGDILSLLNKSYQSKLAHKAGLNTPEEIEINLVNELVIPENIKLPVYCKTASSVEGSKQDQKRCDTREDLYEHLKMLKKDNPNRIILVQEYLNVEEEYIILGACASPYPIISGVVRKLVCTKYTRGLVVLGTISELNSVDGFSEIEKSIINFLNEIPYLGLFDFEIIRANGKLYFNEFNLRASGLGYCMRKAGVNLPATLVDSVLNGRVNNEVYGKMEYGRIFIKEKNALKDLYSHNISFMELMRLFRKADDKLISDKGDIVPGLIFYWHAFKRVIKTCLF